MLPKRQNRMESSLEKVAIDSKVACISPVHSLQIDMTLSDDKNHAKLHRGQITKEVLQDDLAT